MLFGLLKALGLLTGAFTCTFMTILDEPVCPEELL